MVYRAVGLDGTPVALKWMALEVTRDPSFRRRFQREVDVLQRLRHSAIVPILDHGEYEGKPYLIMPYLHGGTLTGRLSSGRGQPSEVLLLARIADALDCAHTQSIVHRDVKPSNILFDANDQPYLTDFGIVKFLGDGYSAVTQTGESLGTPGYMSPEQVLGQPLDGRSDIYALGVVLFEILTGQLPFVDTNPYAQAFKHVSASIPIVSDLNAILGPAWQPIIERALAKQPDARYPTAATLMRDVGQVINPSGMGWTRTTPVLPPVAPTLPVPTPSLDPTLPAPSAVPAPPSRPVDTAAPTKATRGVALWGSLIILLVLLIIGGGIWGVLTLRNDLLPASGILPSAMATDTSTPPPTETMTPANTATAAPPTTIPTPLLPRWRLTSETSLHNGPGSAYPLLASVAAGESVTVIGRDIEGGWLNVRLDDGRLGWLPRPSGALVDPINATTVDVAKTIPAPPPTTSPPTLTPPTAHATSLPTSTPARATPLPTVSAQPTARPSPTAPVVIATEPPNVPEPGPAEPPDTDRPPVTEPQPTADIPPTDPQPTADVP